MAHSTNDDPSRRRGLKPTVSDAAIDAVIEALTSDDGQLPTGAAVYAKVDTARTRCFERLQERRRCKSASALHNPGELPTAVIEALSLAQQRLAMDAAEQFEDTATAYELELTKLKEQLAWAEKARIEVVYQCEDHAKEIEHLQGALQRLQDEHAQLQDEHTPLVTRAAGLTATNQRLVSENTQHKTSLSALSQHHGQLLTDKRDVDKQLAALGTAHAQLQSEQRDGEATHSLAVAEHRAATAQWEKASADTQTSIEDLNAQVQTQQDQHEQDERQLTALRSEVETLTSQATEAITTQAALKKSAQHWQARAEALEAQLADQETRHSDMARLVARLDSMSSTLAKLEPDRTGKQ